MAVKKRKSKKKKLVVVAVSGGFDPLHIGHTRLFRHARTLGDKLVVILNNDHWLRKKRGFVFMSEHERKEVIEALRDVDRVILTKHPRNPKGPEDMSVSRELRKLMPDIFVNGGDRNEKDAANPASSLYHDVNTCRALGIKMIFNVGHGGKIQSSSWLLAEYADNLHRQSKAERRKKWKKKK